MQHDILINWSPQETRVALVENGALQEMHIERSLERGLVGNIYSGKVARVLPGMQSAFIDIGIPNPKTTIRRTPPWCPLRNKCLKVSR